MKPSPVLEFQTETKSNIVQGNHFIHRYRGKTITFHFNVKAKAPYLESTHSDHSFSYNRIHGRRFSNTTFSHHEDCQCVNILQNNSVLPKLSHEPHYTDQLQCWIETKGRFLNLVLQFPQQVNQFLLSSRRKLLNCGPFSDQLTRHLSSLHHPKENSKSDFANVRAIPISTHKKWGYQTKRNLGRKFSSHTKRFNETRIRIGKRKQQVVQRAAIMETKRNKKL